MAKNKNSDVEAGSRSRAARVPDGEMEAAHTGAAFTGKFDINAWLRGVKPIRRTVTVYQDLSLMGERDVVGEALADAKLVGDSVEADRLRAKSRELTDQMQASRLNVVLEGITKTRHNEVLEEAKDDDTLVTAEDVLFYQIAAQIVEPEGIDWAALKAMDDALPQQMEKIGNAWAQINTAAPNLEATLPL